MSWPLVQIGEHVERVETWNPISSGIDDLFKYIDLSSVDKDSKSITESAVNLIHPNSAPSRARQIVKENDVLISTVRPNLNGVALVNQEFDGATASTGYCVLRANKKSLDTKYLFYWVQSSDFIDDMIKNATGANYPAVSDRIVKNNLIPFPPLEEQKRIAAILDKADAIRRKRQQAIKLADDFLRSVFLEMFGDPVINPKGWDLLTLDEVCSKITDGEHGTVARVESGRPYLMARNIDKHGNLDLTEISYISDADHKKIYKRCGAERGDILLVCVGATIGKALIVPEMEEFSLARSVALLKPKDKTSSQYLLYLIKSAGIQQKFVSSGNSSAQAGLYLGKIKALKIPFPPLELQTEFSVVEARIKSILSKYECGQSAPLFESLSQKAFSGQL